MVSSPTAKLRSLATSVPPHELHQSAVMDRAARLFPTVDAEILARLMPVFQNTGIQTRYSCVPPDWYEKPHGWAEKNRLYVRNATDLIEQAAERAISEAGLERDDIDWIVSVSTTGIATPSLDALTVERLGLRPDIRRLPIFGLGCAGGVIGLSRGATIAEGAPGRNVLLVVAELCGLTFRQSDRSSANVVAAALFGDGAAAAVISTEGEGIHLGASGEHTWPGSLDIMGWSVEEDGLGVVFSRDIPTLTRTSFADALANFLAHEGLKLGEVDHFACHPGGAKVLDALEEVFGLENGGLAVSRNVLRDFGNMSAVTVLFVLAELIRNRANGEVLLSALGPGFTAAFMWAHAP